VLFTAIVALLALAALAVMVRGALLTRAGLKKEGSGWIIAGGAGLLVTTAVLILAQQ
jgi:hypothetical protein